jgi:hypothetical protein
MKNFMIALEKMKKRFQIFVHSLKTFEGKEVGRPNSIE